MVDVLLNQTEPVIQLTLAAFLLDVTAKAKGIRVVRVDLEHFLDFLQGERQFIFLATRTGAVQQLANRLLPAGLIDLDPQHGHLGIQMAFSLQLSEYFRRELEVSLRVSSSSAFD